MNEWFDSQKKPSSDYPRLLKERIEKTHLRSKLTTEETKRLADLEAIAVKLELGENEQNRQLQTWLSKHEYAQARAEWQEQLELREELKDKPGESKQGVDKREQYEHISQLLHIQKATRDKR